MNFAKSVLFKSYGEKTTFCCAGTIGPTTTKGPKGPIYKKGVDASLHPSTSWG